VDDSVYETCIRLYGGVPSERLNGAQERLERAERKWAAAVTRTDELLRRDRQVS
jgi:hypothetical protein